MYPDARPDPPARPRRRAAARMAALVTLAAAGVVAWLTLDVPDAAELRRWADATGAWFPLVFFLAYVGFTQLPVPRTIFTVSAGVLLGPAWGLALALAATGVSGALSLTVVRSLGREWVRERVDGPLLRDVDRRLERRGWLAVGSLRLIPGIPFSILNYACAMTPVPVAPFTAATILGSAPGTAAGVLIGDTLTGDFDWRSVAFLGALVFVGMAGLFIESRLPMPAAGSAGEAPRAGDGADGAPPAGNGPRASQGPVVKPPS